MQTCRYMQGYMECPIDAMSLSECIKRQFWPDTTCGNGPYAAHIICTEYGP